MPEFVYFRHPTNGKYYRGTVQNETDAKYVIETWEPHSHTTYVVLLPKSAVRSTPVATVN